MVETLFCWAVELPPASGACLLTSRWLWKLKNNFRGKSPQRQGQSCQYILFIFQLNFSDILTARFPISFGSQVFISIRPKWSIGRSVSFIFLWSHFNQSTFQYILTYISSISMNVNIFQCVSIYFTICQYIFLTTLQSEHISPKLLPILTSPVNIACSSNNAPKKYYHHQVKQSPS